MHASASRLRILFAGTPLFAVPALERLISDGFAPVGVLTQPDRPTGRGRKLQASPVKQTAENAGIPVRQPVSLKAAESIEFISGLRPDLMIVVAYGLILPAAVLEIPVWGCWNIHASLLPRWRGAAPIQRAIEAGDKETGICIMQMDEGLDTGPVLHCVRTRIRGDETGGSLHDRLALMGAEALSGCVQSLASNHPPTPRIQEAVGVSYARKLEKAEAEIDWCEPAAVLERRIRAFNPWPVAWCRINSERTRIWCSSLVPLEHDQQPGDVLGAGPDGIDIATGSQVLRLLELQRPGGRRIAVRDYLNAVSIPHNLDKGTHGPS